MTFGNARRCCRGMWRDDDVRHFPQWMTLRQGLRLENVEPGTRNFAHLKRRGQVGEVDNHPSTDVYEIGRALHLPNSFAIEELECLRCVRSRDDDKIALGQH